VADSGTYARFETSEGNFKVRLFDKEAPNTVANFTGLAEGTRDGRRVVYRLTPGPFAAAAQWMGDVGAAWDRRLAALSAAVNARR